MDWITCRVWFMLFGAKDRDELWWTIQLIGFAIMIIIWLILDRKAIAKFFKSEEL